MQMVMVYVIQKMQSQIVQPMIPIVVVYAQVVMQIKMTVVSAMVMDLHVLQV